VALSMPPIVGPVREATISVLQPITAASGISDSAAAKKVITGGAPRK